MMISERMLQHLKEQYPSGCRVELLRMDGEPDMYPGLKGTVKNVDDIGTIHVSWDNGHSLGVVYGEDSVKRIGSEVE